MQVLIPMRQDSLFYTIWCMQILVPLSYHNPMISLFLTFEARSFLFGIKGMYLFVMQKVCNSLLFLILSSRTPFEPQIGPCVTLYFLGIMLFWIGLRTCKSLVYFACIRAWCVQFLLLSVDHLACMLTLWWFCTIRELFAFCQLIVWFGSVN